jgi:hypothetical protein
MIAARDDYDSPWKEALERYFPAFMALGFPEAYAGIDWARGYEFLDKELQPVVRDAELGRRLADKLIKVWRVDGEEAWVLIHLEVQGQVETGFAKRMFTRLLRLPLSLSPDRPLPIVLSSAWPCSVMRRPAGALISIGRLCGAAKSS